MKAACGSPGSHPYGVSQRTPPGTSLHVLPCGWADTHTTRWDALRLHWCGKATYKTCWWRICPSPAASAAWSHPHKAPDVGTAVGVTHSKWGSTSPKWHGAASWTWPAGTTSGPYVQILTPVGTVESKSHISGWQYRQWQKGMQNSLAAQRGL